MTAGQFFIAIRETAIELLSITVIIAAPLLALAVYVGSIVGNIGAPDHRSSRQISRAAND